MSFLQNMLGQAVPSSYGQQGLANANAAQNQLLQAYQAAQTRAQGTTTAINPNEIEAYQIPLSTLVNMWRAKFNDEWTMEHLLKDAFYKHGFVRLLENNLFERSPGGWMRLKEGV